MTGLEVGIRDIASSVRDLAGKLDAKSVTPWGVIAAFGMLSVAVLGGFGKLAYDPIKDKQDRMEILVERVLDKAEAGDRRVNERLTDIDKGLRAIIVPRAEIDLAFKSVQTQMDALASRVGRGENRDRP